jgi:hypothetical protein
VVFVDPAQLVEGVAVQVVEVHVVAVAADAHPLATSEKRRRDNHHWLSLKKPMLKLELRTCAVRECRGERQARADPNPRPPSASR